MLPSVQQNGRSKRKDAPQTLQAGLPLPVLFAEETKRLDDAKALALVYKEWGRERRWCRGKDAAEWKGVRAVNDAGEIAKLNLCNLDIQGAIPPEIGTLVALRVLRLDRNKLCGRIPRELGHLAALRLLDLGGNSLEGPIPNELGALVHPGRLREARALAPNGSRNRPDGIETTDVPCVSRREGRTCAPRHTRALKIILRPRRHLVCAIETFSRPYMRRHVRSFESHRSVHIRSSVYIYIYGIRFVANRASMTSQIRSAESL